MVNQAALDAVEESVSKVKESMAALKFCRWRRVMLKDNEPVKVKFIVPLSWKMVIAGHSFDGEGGFYRLPILCPKLHYGKKGCKICKKTTVTKDGKKISNAARPVWAILVLNLDVVGETYKKGEKRYWVNPFQILEIRKGGDGESEDNNWTELQEAHENKTLYKYYYQFKRQGKKGMLPPKPVPKEVIQEQYQGGKLPPEWKEEWDYIKGLVNSDDQEEAKDEYLGWILRAYSNVDEEFFGITLPEEEFEQFEAPDEADGEDMDEDYDVEDRPKRKKPGAKKPSRSQRAEEYEDDEDEEEEEDPKPSRKPKAKAKPPVKKKRPSEYEDDEEEDEEED